MDNPKIDLAGVETGAKMFVGPRGGAAASLAAADQSTNTNIWSTFLLSLGSVQFLDAEALNRL
jgi:hypothetical protein